MRLRGAAFGLCLAAQPAAGQDRADLLLFADCIGQGDAYAEAARDYGFDHDAARVAADRRFASLARAAPDDAAALGAARAKGLEDWKRRAAALRHSGMSGPAWDEHVASAFACDEARDRLEATGLRLD